MLDSTSIIVGIIIGSSIFRSSSADRRAGSQCRLARGSVGDWRGVFASSVPCATRNWRLPTPKRAVITSSSPRPLAGRSASSSPGPSSGSSAPARSARWPLSSPITPTSFARWTPSYRPLLIYAVGAVVVLSGINLLGVRAGKWTQNLLTLVKFLGLVGHRCGGHEFFRLPRTAPPAAAARPRSRLIWASR